MEPPDGTDDDLMRIKDLASLSGLVARQSVSLGR